MDSRLLFRDKAITDRNVLSHGCDVKDTCIVTHVNDVFISQQAVEVQYVLGWGGVYDMFTARPPRLLGSCYTTSGFDVYSTSARLGSLFSIVAPVEFFATVAKYFT